MPHDACFWCGRVRCRLSHVWDMAAYRNALHERAKDLLIRDAYLRGEKREKNYQDIVWENALKAGKDPYRELQKAKWQKNHIFLDPGDARTVYKKLVTYLRKRGLTRKFNGPINKRTA